VQESDVKTSKKGRKRLKCRHEIIAGFFYGDEELEATTEKTCNNCTKVYRETGGHCKYCSEAVTYCTKKCQVNLN
jgi:hypothetical protein